MVASDNFDDDDGYDLGGSASTLERDDKDSIYNGTTPSDVYNHSLSEQNKQPLFNANQHDTSVMMESAHAAESLQQQQLSSNMETGIKSPQLSEISSPTDVIKPNEESTPNITDTNHNESKSPVMTDTISTVLNQVDSLATISNDVNDTQTDEKMEVDVISVTTHHSSSSTTSSPISSRKTLPPRQGSRSAPSSPTRPKIFRSTSAHNHGSCGEKGDDKRGDQDLETASILVGMSQTKMKNGSKGDLSFKYSSLHSNSPYVSSHNGGKPQKPAVLCVPQGYSIVGRVGGPSLPGQPMRFYNPQNGTPPNQHFHRSTVRPSTSEKHRTTHKEQPPRSPQPIPPDSPDSSRREFQEPQKREFPRDDKTRLFLQEKINKERDRSCGKRSVPFFEEFDDYKTNTRKAAKRALFGHNPFNIGVSLPDNFLLRADKRTYQSSTPSVNSGVMKFFASSLDKKSQPEEDSKSRKSPSPATSTKSTPFDPYMSLSDLGMLRSQRGYPVSSQQQTTPQPNSALDPYKTSEDMRKFRESALLKQQQHQQQQQQQQNEKSIQPEIHGVVQGIKDMHAHSPKDISVAAAAYDEMRGNRPPDRRVFIPTERGDMSSTSCSVTTATTNVFTVHPHGLSSIFMPVQQVRFPYGHPNEPSQNPYVLPSSVAPASSRGKKGPGGTPYPPSYILPIHTDRQRPLLPISPGTSPYVLPPTIPVSHVKYPQGPPNLQRFESRSGIFRTEYSRVPVTVVDSSYTTLHNLLPVRPTATLQQPELHGAPHNAHSKAEHPQSQLTSSIPKVDRIVSCGTKDTKISPSSAPQNPHIQQQQQQFKDKQRKADVEIGTTPIKKEVEDIGYASSFSSVNSESTSNNNNNNSNNKNNQTPLSPRPQSKTAPNLFSPTEPKLFQAPVPKNVLKKHISRADLKYDKRDIIGRVCNLKIYSTVGNIFCLVL